MTYAVEKKVVGRQAIIFASFAMDFCDNVYGSSPCTATGSGDAKCFNTIPGCQDLVNYVEAGKTYLYCDGQGSPLGVDALPCIISYDPIPAKADPGKTLGERPGVRLVMRDFPHHDRGTDPYTDDRTYDPEARGTYWGKWLARNKYFAGRYVTIKTGFLTDPFDWANFESRTYVLDKASVDSHGNVTFTLRDVLKLADDKRALCPAPSSGKLASDLTNVETGSMTLDDVTEYPSSGTVRIGKEMISYTSKTGTTNGTLNTLTRGVYGTTDNVAAHSTDDAVQECAVLTGNVTAILKTLFEDYANIDSSFIPYAGNWTDETTEYLSGYTLTGVISEPTGVTKLANELVEQCRLMVWFNDKDQEVNLKVIVQRRDTTTTEVNESNTVRDSVSIDGQDHERVSRVIIAYGIKDYTGRLDDGTNFSRAYVAWDADAEDTTQYGDKRVKIIYSRWFTSANDAAVATSASRLLNQLRDGVKKAYFKLDLKDLIDVGDVFSFSTKTIQGLDGATKSASYQAVGVKEAKVGHQYMIEAISTGAQLRGFYIAPAGIPDYASATAEQKNKYGFICSDTHKFYDGEGPYGVI